MFNVSKTISAASLSLALLLTPTASQAALVNYNFSGSIDSGALVGESYFGSFAFDNAALTNSGNESINLSALTFNFMSSSFGLADAEATASADFLDGVLLGISYTVSTFEPAFALISAAGTGLAEDVAYFAYTPTTGDAGYGSFNLTAVPLPGTIWLFGSCLAWLGLVGRRDPK